VKRSSWGKSGRIDFTRFKLECYNKSCTLGPLIVWSQIRSFIKGSIEAIKNGRPLTREEYYELGRNRCRLSREQREAAYSAYEYYQSILDSQGELWDDTDRMIQLLRCIRGASADALAKLRVKKIYVDEIQDYTQAEIAAFFYLGSPGGLFLAGDNAQSVVEGVDFRFDEVRSIGHTLFDGDIRYIPDKPVKVRVNFRSHSGILNMAAAILDRLFAAFPKSVSALERDTGAFSGPRPGLIQKMSNTMLTQLVERIDGVVLLTHDEKVDEIRKVVGDEVMVFGIRYSKGLEFPHVIIVDFFSSLPESDQKAWKSLLSIRSDQVSGVEKLKDESPEVETQLKLLYTAITRCSKRLFLAERESSIAGNQFFKWSKMKKDDQPPLSVEQSVDDVDRLQKTADEWVASGVECGMQAETEMENDLEKARFWLKRAAADFTKGGHAEFYDRAMAHLEAVDIAEKITSIEKDSNSRLPVELELNASLAILALLKHSLVEQANRMMIDYVTPFVSEYTKRRLEKEVVSHLPTLAEDVDGAQIVH